MRICKLDGGGGERPRILCASFFSLKLPVRYSMLLFPFFFFFVLLHFTLSFTSARSFAVILVHQRVNQDCILVYCFPR